MRSIRCAVFAAQKKSGDDKHQHKRTKRFEIDPEHGADRWNDVQMRVDPGNTHHKKRENPSDMQSHGGGKQNRDRNGFVETLFGKKMKHKVKSVIRVR